MFYSWYLGGFLIILPDLVLSSTFGGMDAGVCFALSLGVICWGQETVFPATASHGKIIFNHHFKLAGESLSQQFSIFVKMASNNPNDGDGNGMENWDKES